MEMVTQSNFVGLPKAATEPKETAASKKGQDEDFCLSFPSMLEQKQAPESKQGTAATPATVNGSGTAPTIGNSPEEVSVKPVTAAVSDTAMSKNELPLAASSEGPVSSLAGFLKSLTFVDQEEPKQVEPLNKALEKSTTNQTSTPATVDGITESIANIVKNAAVEASIKTIPTEASGANSLQVAAPIGHQLPATQESVNGDPKAANPNTGLAIELSETMPGKTQAAPAKPAMETLVQATDKPAPEKPQVGVRDVVLASNKTPESTYAAPEKMALEKPTQKTVLPEATASVESDLGKEIKGKAKTADAGQVTTQNPQASQRDSSKPITAKPANGAEAPAATESAPVQAEAQTPLENFTVPTEIKMSIGTHSTHATLDASQDSTTANIRQQVIQHLASRMEGPLGGEKITLYLNPEKLGQVEVQITAKNDTLTVVLSAGEGQVEKAIQDSVKDLTESLLARGGRFQQVDVKVDSKSTQNDREQSRQDENKDKESQNQKDSHRDHKQQKEPKQPAWAHAMQEG